MLHTKRCFISGPMTGKPDLNKQAFFEAEEKLRKAEFSVFNPARLGLEDGGFTDQMILGIDLAALSHCNYIYMLDGWACSKGASAEWSYATYAGIKFVNDEWLDWYLKELEGREKILDKLIEKKGEIIVCRKKKEGLPQECTTGKLTGMWPGTN
ncbi:MAG: DUF4406 domain-containing protein [Bacteroidota bacterium]|nr:DUF4406 domain-containing protein [Bacteroidota bacterium]